MRELEEFVSWDAWREFWKPWLLYMVTPVLSIIGVLLWFVLRVYPLEVCADKPHRFCDCLTICKEFARQYFVFLEFWEA